MGPALPMDPPVGSDGVPLMMVGVKVGEEKL